MTDLFDNYSKEVLAKFKSFHAENPHVYAEFKSNANQLKKAGLAHYSAQAIIYKMRFDHDLKTSGKPFKITNDFTSIYSRLLVYNDESFVGFFRMHNQKNNVKPDTEPEYL